MEIDVALRVGQDLLSLLLQRANLLRDEPELAADDGRGERVGALDLLGDVDEVVRRREPAQRVRRGPRGALVKVDLGRVAFVPRGLLVVRHGREGSAVPARIK